MVASEQLAYLERLEPLLSEFSPPMTAGEAAPGAYYARNQSFESVDADLLYATVRSSRPQAGDRGRLGVLHPGAGPGRASQRRRGRTRRGW